MTEIIGVDAETTHTWVEAGEALLIDVREAEELSEVRLSGAVHVPMSAFDPNAVPTDSGKKLVFICAQGMRSLQVGQHMLDQGLLDEAYNLHEGLTAWVQAGLPCERE